MKDQPNKLFLRNVSNRMLLFLAHGELKDNTEHSVEIKTYFFLAAHFYKSHHNISQSFSSHKNWNRLLASYGREDICRHYECAQIPNVTAYVYNHLSIHSSISHFSYCVWGSVGNSLKIWKSVRPCETRNCRYESQSSGWHDEESVLERAGAGQC